MNRRRCVASLAGLLFLVGVAPARSEEPARRGPDPAAFDKTLAKTIEYLRTKAQNEDGSYGTEQKPSITAMITAGLIRNGRSLDDPLVAKGLKYLESCVQPDGGIYSGANYKNYETCLSVMCFVEANKDGRYAKQIKAAEKYVRGLQWGEGLEDSDRRRGGQGYGSKGRPDLSNTAMFIDALRATGNGYDDPAIQAALKFVSQCQNHESEHNTGPFAAKNPDGGFAYTPDDSQAGKDDATGGLRSYASMTYAGLKSMIYAGVREDDPRVKAAVSWVKKNYALDKNPGIGEAGLYYYYHVFAKSLAVFGHDEFVDAAGKRHDWRKELFEALASQQAADGSWTNAKSARFMEGNPQLVTAYALLSLSYCKNPPAKPAATK